MRGCFLHRSLAALARFLDGGGLILPQLLAILLLLAVDVAAGGTQGGFVFGRLLRGLGQALIGELASALGGLVAFGQSTRAMGRKNTRFR